MKMLSKLSILAVSAALLSACGGDSGSSGDNGIIRQDMTEPLEFATIPLCPIKNNIVTIGVKSFDDSVYSGRCKVKTPKLINGREFTLDCLGRGLVDIRTAEDVDPNIIKKELETQRVFTYQCA